MKQFVFILSLFAINVCFAQNNKQDVLERLAIKIRARNLIETHYVGCWGNPNSFYPSIDSFITLLTIQDAEKYFEDTCKPLKYYAFVSLLKNGNDSLAFQKLKTIINDTSKVVLFIAGASVSYEKPINLFISALYKEVINIKYIHTSGGINSINFCFKSEEKNKKTYKAKLKEYKREIESQMPNFKH